MKAHQESAALDAATEPAELVHEVPCAIASFGDDGVVHFANRVLLSMVGLEADALAGRSIESILTVSSRIFYQTHFFPLLQLHGKAEEVFMTLRSRTGEAVPVLANAVRRRRGDEAVSHCVFVPVRQRQQYEEEILAAKRAAEEAVRSNHALIEAQKALEVHALELDRQLSQAQRQHEDLTDLTTILSHDLREPIRKVSVFTGVVRHELGERLTPDLDMILGRMMAATQRMDQIVQVLRAYLAIDVNADAVEEVDLHDALRRAEARLQAETGFHDYHLEAGTLPVVEGHRQQLVTLFYHLLDNAVKFRRPGVPLRVTVDGAIVQYNQYRSSRERYKYVDYAQVTFRDNGMGFEPRYAGYVFEMLKKIDPATPGLGTGLAFCSKIAQNHFGSISADAAPGEGTTFTILLRRFHDDGAAPER